MRKHRRKNAGSRNRSTRHVYSTEKYDHRLEEVPVKPFDPALARLQRDWAHAVNACEWMDLIEAQELTAHEEVVRDLAKGPVQLPIRPPARVLHSIVGANAADIEAAQAFRALWGKL